MRNNIRKKYPIVEGALSRIADTAYAVRFLRLLVTPWEKTEAYKNGIIDIKGKRIKDKKTADMTTAEKSSYTIFHRLVFNIKRLLPGKRLGSYFAALYLIKEHTGMSDKKIEDILNQALEEPIEPMNESQWFMEGVNRDQLMMGTYMLISDIASPTTGEIIAFKKSKVQVEEHIYPTGTIMDINIYEVKHIQTGQKIYVTNQDIVR